MKEKEVLKMIATLRATVVSDSRYGQGYHDALAFIEEAIIDEAWERGEQLDDEDEE